MKVARNDIMSFHKAAGCTANDLWLFYLEVGRFSRRDCWMLVVFFFYVCPKQQQKKGCYSVLSGWSDLIMELSPCKLFSSLEKKMFS